MIERDYKFYLSFENSMCKDYVTEVFFDAMNRTILPVVLGGDPEIYDDIAPTHSFINVQPEFKDPQVLGI